jgi:ribonuclease T2
MIGLFISGLLRQFFPGPGKRLVRLDPYLVFGEVGAHIVAGGPAGKREMRALLLLLCLAGMARAEGEAAGDFDYYVMALSWSPSWCATEGDDRGSPQCREGARFGWVLHGLWPQYEDGWPSWCRTVQNDPSRAMTAAMEDIMGTDGAAWYQWQKHGRCSGLTAGTYLGAARMAYQSVTKPEVFGRLRGDVRLPASVVEEAFLEANPQLGPDMVTVTCGEGRIAEVRVCLTRRLEPRPCGADVRRDCTMRDALMEPPR